MSTGQGAGVVRIRFGSWLDVGAWASRHAAGEVPDRWPYGLDRLSAYGLDARAVSAPASARWASRPLRVAGGYEWWGTRSGRTAGEPELCWDERIGVPVAWWARSVPRSRRPAVATGVIWLTDRTRARAAHRAVAGPALRSAQLVWALSSAQLPVLRDEFGVPPARLAHLPFGIDADFFHPTGTQPTPGLVVGAGNDRHRDHQTLLAAMHQVRQKVPGARLELATRLPIDVPGELGVRYPALSHGAMRDLYARGTVAAVALHPNLHVSGVTVALEAMACGRPVVVTDTPGMRDYVADGETGLLVPPGDPAALATAVAELLLDPDQAAALGAAGRRAVERGYTTGTQARRLAELLAALVR